MARHPLHEWTLTGGEVDNASLLIEIHPHARPERSTTINVQPGAEVYFVTFSSHEDGADFAYGDADQIELTEELLQQAVERTQGPTRLTQTVLDGVIVKSESPSTLMAQTGEPPAGTASASNTSGLGCVGTPRLPWLSTSPHSTTLRPHRPGREILNGRWPLRTTSAPAACWAHALMSVRRSPDSPRVVRGRADVLSSTSTSALWHHPQGGPQLVHQAPDGFRTTYQCEDVNFLAIDKAQDNHPDQGCACAGDPQPVVARRTHT